jgi:hypothetical protein
MIMKNTVLLGMWCRVVWFMLNVSEERNVSMLKTGVYRHILEDVVFMNTNVGTSDLTQ